MVDPLLSREGRSWLLNSLLETPPADIERSCNIQLLNLLCAEALPGSESLDIRGCLNRLDHLTEYIRGSIERTYRAYGAEKHYSYCKFKTWMGCLVTRMKQTFGASYSPKAKADLEAGIDAPLDDASEVFIHGLLREDRSRRWGTCTSIPVLVTAIARKLGYPVHLAVAKQHVYCRWEGEGRCFNIEASNAMGMTVQPDETFRQLRGGIPAELDNGFHFRSLTPAEEFACFMQQRLAVLRDAKRFDETLIWAARTLQFSPENRFYPPEAFQLSLFALQQRYRLRYPGKDAPLEHGAPINFGDVAKLITIEERPLVQTISAHFHEWKGSIERARVCFEDACRQGFDGGNEQRDFQRFLKKHGLPRKKGPLFYPKNLGFPRRFIMKCKPEEEAIELRQMADYYEKKGDLLKAHASLHDLYMYDPSDAEVFQRTRELRVNPIYQQQSKDLMDQQRRILEKEGRLPKKTDKLLAQKSVPATPVNVSNIKGPLNIVNSNGRRLTSN